MSARTQTRDRPRAQHLVALCVVPAVIAVACLPFLFNEHTGVLGEGIYTNDQAAQLYWADWLADGFGPQPNAVSVGYPVGPQALAASVSEGTTVNLVDTFNGLLVAIPALTALAALSLLGGLPPWRRGLAAGLTGLPYLGASFLAQSGFKETVMAMLVVALAIVLHLALRRKDEDREAPPARAVVGVIAVLAAASVFTFSIPGGVWFAIAIPVWAILTVGFGNGTIDISRARAAASEHRGLLIGGALALVALALIVIGPARDFIDKIDEVQGSSGRLSSPVFPGEALGIWPEGDFRVVRGDVDGSLVATLFAALCALGAGVALIRKREWALLSVVAAAVFVYALARPYAQIHVEAKALCVLAPIAMLITVRWLLAPGKGTGPLLRQATGALFCALALISSLLALRAAPVGFNDRGADDLRALAEQIDGGSVVFLGVDRFAGYWLRGTLAESPGGYVPQDVDARPEKTWQQGLAMDFDTLSPSKLDNYDFAITTSAAYASTPPPSFEEVAREGDYVLWERTGRHHLEARARGGRRARQDPRLSGSTEPGGGGATVLPEPITIDQGDWEPTAFASAPAHVRRKRRGSGGRYSDASRSSTTARCRSQSRWTARRSASCPLRSKASISRAPGAEPSGPREKLDIDRRPGRDRDRGRGAERASGCAGGRAPGLDRHACAERRRQAVAGDRARKRLRRVRRPLRHGANQVILQTPHPSSSSAARAAAARTSLPS